MGRARDDEVKREAAAIARRLGVCPACGKKLDGPGYGTGRIADGDFCSLNCVADYWYSDPGRGGRSMYSRDY